MRKSKENWLKEVKDDILNSFLKFLKIIIMMFFSVCFLLLPVLLIDFIEQVLKIEYNKYIEVLKIIVNSWYIVLVAIICIVFYFGKELATKILEITSILNILKFGAQDEKMNDSKMTTLEKTVMEKSEENEIIRKIKEGFLQNKEKILEENNTDVEDLRLKNEFLILENTRLIMSKMTEYVLKSVYIEKGLFKSFSKADIEKYLREIRRIAPDIIKRSMFKREIKIIVYFLTSYGIIETEDDFNYDITEFGRKFIRYIFEGGI